MSEIPELRVHGVSGTHPRNMLYTDPVIREWNEPDRPAWTGVYSRPKSDDRAEAFHWGGVTSGAPLTAFWLLLLPFAVLNTAGWMATPRAPRPVFVASVRLAGLMLTGVFVLQGLTVLFDLPWHALDGEPIHASLAWVWAAPRATGAGLLVISMALFGLLTRVASASHFEERSTAWKRIWAPRLESMIPDQTYAVDVSTMLLSPSADEMWARHATTERLARLHVAFGLVVIGTVATSAAAGSLLSAPRTLAGGLCVGLIGLIVVVGLVSSRASGKGLVDRIIVWLPLVSLATTVVGIGAFMASEAQPGSTVPGLYDLAFSVIVVLALAVVATFLSGFSTRPAALITVGALLGGGLGAGLAAGLERSLELENALPDGLGWFAAASLYGFLLILAMGALLLARSARPEGHPLQALRGVVARVGLVFNGFFVATVGAIATLVALRGQDLFLTDLPPVEDFSPDLGRGALALYLLTALLVTFAWLRMGRFGLVGLTVLGFGLGLVIMRIGFPETQILGVPLDLGTFPAIAATTAVLLPASLIVTSVFGGLRSHDRRRGVGILWDLAGMWPRWYHPFAPPPYGPKVITDLSREVTHRLSRDRLLLAAHSQGSVLGAIVARRLTLESRSRLSLLTYGSPLAPLYERFFPSHFGQGWLPGLANELALEQGSRWRNLWRDSDPIGGPIAGVDDQEPITSRRRGHGLYELEDRFRATRAALWS